MTRIPRCVCICVVLLSSLCAALAGGPKSTDPAQRKTQAAAKKIPDVQSILKRKVKSFRFRGSFLGALTKLAIESRLKITPQWKTLISAGAGKDKVVKVDVSGVRVEQVLDVILASAAKRGAPLGWVAKKGLIRVSTQRAILKARRTAPRLRSGKKNALRRVNFDSSKLVDVIDFFREVSGANFHVNWKSLAEVDVTKDTKIDLHVSNVSIGRAMDLVMSQLSVKGDRYSSVYWIIDEGIVMIATGSTLDSKMRTKVIDLGTLLVTPPDIPMPKRIGLEGMTDDNDRNNNNNRSDNDGLWGDDDGNDDNGGDNIVDKRQKTVDNLLMIIRRSIGEEMWTPDGKGSVKVLGNRLVITQSLLGFKLLDKSLGK